MCSNLEEVSANTRYHGSLAVARIYLQTQHMIKAIGTLLSFTPEEFQYVQKSIEYKVCRELWDTKINNNVMSFV